MHRENGQGRTGADGRRNGKSHAARAYAQAAAAQAAAPPAGKDEAEEAALFHRRRAGDEACEEGGEEVEKRKRACLNVIAELIRNPVPAANRSSLVTSAAGTSARAFRAFRRVPGPPGCMR